MPQYQGGQEVFAAVDIYLTERDGTQTNHVLARQGERMVVRCASPLEVSSYSNPLLAFDVAPNQITDREF